MLCFVFAATLLASLCSTVAGFGLTESGDSYIVDTSAGLIFTVDSTSGDITSMKFNGIEAQDSSKYSQIASGIDADCSWVRGGHDNNYITVTPSVSPADSPNSFPSFYRLPAPPALLFSSHLSCFQMSSHLTGLLQVLRCQIQRPGHPYGYLHYS